MHPGHPVHRIQLPLTPHPLCSWGPGNPVSLISPGQEASQRSPQNAAAPEAPLPTPVGQWPRSVPAGAQPTGQTRALQALYRKNHATSGHRTKSRPTRQQKRSPSEPGPLYRLRLPKPYNQLHAVLSSPARTIGPPNKLTDEPSNWANVPSTQDQSHSGLGKNSKPASKHSMKLGSTSART